MLNDAQKRVFSDLTWPTQYNGGVAYGIDTVLSINGCKVVLYPSGKIDILTVSGSEFARASEKIIREKYGHLILDHVRTLYNPLTGAR
jgi:hypothetical protein